MLQFTTVTLVPSVTSDTEKLIFVNIRQRLTLHPIGIYEPIKRALIS